MKIDVNNRMFIFAIVFFMSGCSAGINQIDKNYELSKNNEKEAVVIMKLEPRNIDKSVSELFFRRNAIDKNGELYSRYLTGDDGNYSEVKAEHGYFVFKVELMNSNIVNVMAKALESNSKSSESKYVLGNDCGGEALAFNIRESGVYYLGDVKYWKEVTNIGEVKNNLLIENDFKHAKEFLSEHYPNLKNEPIQQNMIKKYWKTDECEPTKIYI